MEPRHRRPRGGEKGESLHSEHTLATGDGAPRDEDDRERADEPLGRPQQDEHPGIPVRELHITQQLEAIADPRHRCEQDGQRRCVRVPDPADLRLIEVEHVAVGD